MNLRELQTEAHAIAVAKGWHDRDGEVTFGDYIALVHRKLSEVLAAYRARGLGGWVELRVVEKDPPPPPWDRTAFTHDVLNKPCGVASELADAVIRLADMAEHYGVENLDAFIGQYDEWDLSSMGTFGEWVTAGHLLTSKAVEAFFDGDDDQAIKRSFGRLGSLIVLIQRMAAHYGIDLDAAIEAKMAYNKTRPYRHGGKAL